MSLQSFRPSMDRPVLPTLHLVEEINHRVVNTFAEAIASLSLAARRAGGPSPQAVLAEAASRLHAHAEAHRALFAPRAAGLVDLGDYVGRLFVSLSTATLADKRIRLALETDDVWIDAERGWRVGLILAELVRNAARHGLRDGCGGIRVRILERGGEVTCLVEDDGPPVAAVTPGRGQAVVCALADELTGQVDWTFGPEGCRARLRFPVLPRPGAD